MTPISHRLRRRWDGLALKNKIMLSSIGVIILVSISIALVSRYILVSSLTRELEQRGMGIAQAIAEQSTGLILTRDKPRLISLVFEAAQVGERQTLVDYIFVADVEGEVLASTFLTPFPPDLAATLAMPVFNPQESGGERRIELVNAGNGLAYDVAVPVKEGIYNVGSVHVGLSKSHIDAIIAKLRLAFFGFISIIFAVFFFVSDRLSRSITRPISGLIAMSEAISRDDLDFVEKLGAREGVGQDDDTVDPAPGDEVKRLAESFYDMARHIRAYRGELKRSQQKYRSLFHSGPDPIFVLECGARTILDANPVACEVYGYSMKELVGMSFDRLWDDTPYPDEAACPDPFAPLTPGGEDADAEAWTRCLNFSKVLHFKKGGEPFYVNAHACAAIYEDKPAVIVSTNDITDMVEKDAQLIQASKMKSLGEMSAGMAHELNQPLNAIKMGADYLSLMADEGRSISPERYMKVAGDISRQADRAAEIIDHLRQFSRMAAPDKERVDPNRPVRGVLGIMSRQLVLDNIEVDLDLTEGLPPILVHNNRLEQVLFNLLANARDALSASNGPRPGDGGGHRRIRVRTWAEEGRVRLAVADTGPGIPPETRDKVFEPFYTTKEIGSGMGLGLAISYGIIQDYGGEIELAETPGGGATFTISFPTAV